MISSTPKAFRTVHDVQLGPPVSWANSMSSADDDFLATAGCYANLRDVMLSMRSRTWCRQRVIYRDPQYGKASGLSHIRQYSQGPA